MPDKYTSYSASLSLSYTHKLLISPHRDGVPERLPAGRGHQAPATDDLLAGLAQVGREVAVDPRPLHAAACKESVPPPRVVRAEAVDLGGGSFIQLGDTRGRETVWTCRGKAVLLMRVLSMFGGQHVLTTASALIRPKQRITVRVRPNSDACTMVTLPQRPWSFISARKLARACAQRKRDGERIRSNAEHSAAVRAREIVPMAKHQ